MAHTPAMELTILGSGTAVPSLRRGAPGHLLRLGADRLMLDTGPGTMQRLIGQGVRHDEVTHIFYSHNHIDHTGELASWLFTSRIPGRNRTRPLTLVGSPGFAGMLDGLRRLYGHWLEAAGYELTQITMRPGEAHSFGSFSVRAFPVQHIDSSLAYRIETDRGATFAYTGDTDMCDSLVELSREADLLLIEASTPDARKLPGHLTPSEAGAVARQAGAGKVVLTHFFPECEGADMIGSLRRVYDGEAIMAEDGLKVAP
ncbi:MAG TPA: ribonuclease Z [Candidatus Polarisedimenticolia bacterium]|nr:ribonuclease Z [Candidatus Polarisedimenticolia bacterium]